MTTDERLDQLEKLMREGFQQVNQRLDGVTEPLDGVGQGFAGVDLGFDRLDASIADLRTEMIGRFAELENRIEMMRLTLQSLDMRTPAFTKAIMDLQVRFEKLERPAVLR